MSRFQDAFISYGRADSKTFAKKLNDRLVEQGLEVWFDFEDIPLGVDYQSHIDQGIGATDNFLFVISPHAVNSPYCAKEIALAVKLKKRIIPLLHVERISRELWQQRHPKGTEIEWQEYRSQGLHSSFPNMHPEIARINWVYFREGVEDFDHALSDLISIFERHRSHIRQHTYFLNKALEWERNYRQTRYLLIGEEHQQARNWLKFGTQVEQPPCVPTDLHCEFITESIKNANNLMTQVFLCWEDQDRSVMEQIRIALMRQSFTVWMNKSDIRTGANYHQVIQQGIEEADNLVCLVSPASVQSIYCLQEVQYALSLNKRIVPIMVQPVDLMQVPPEFRSLQYIDMTDSAAGTSPEERLQRGLAELIRILRQDATYFEDHKILLSKALKWERQRRNPCLLLRGYNLRYAETWLKIAQQRSQHPAVALQQTFIEESLRQPPGLALDVFVSYSRKDSDFARKLNEILQIQGKTTWFDQESIAAGTADFQQEIYRGIESSSHFLFVISPNAVNSPYCNDEVGYAVRLNKRIITVLHQDVDPGILPPGLANVQWIDFNHHDQDFDANFRKLLRALDTDPDHLRIHTRLLMQALEWDHNNRDESLLLRGSVLKEVQQWLLECEHKVPAPTEFQRHYVAASNIAQIRRQRSTLQLQRVGLALISMVSLVAIGSTWFAIQQYNTANRIQLVAKQGEVLAHQRQILAETKTSEALFQSNRELEALLEAMRAGIQLQRDQSLQQSELPAGDLKASVVTALQQAVFWVQEKQRIEGHQGIIWEVAISPDGQLIASASADGKVKLWRMDGTLHREFKQSHPRLAVTFTPDHHLVVGEADGTITIYSLDNGDTKVISGHDAAVVGVAVSPDNRWIASASEDGTVKLWDRNGKLLKTLVHQAAARSVTFSPDSKTLASASDDGLVRLWNLEGTLLKTLRGHTAEVRAVAFSPDGKLLASASWDETIRLWKADGTPIRTIEGTNTLIYDVQFSPDGKTLASSSWDKTIKIWTLDGALLSTLAGHSALVRSIRFNAKDNTIVSAGADRTVRIWALDRPLLAALKDHRARVYSVVFSPDDQLIASAGADNQVRLWDRKGRPQGVLRGHQSVIWSVDFSPDGQTIASGSSDHTIKLWSRNGQLKRTLEGHAGPIYAVTFSPDGKLIASASADQTVRLWRSDGTLIRTLRNFDNGLLNVRFSPDGKQLATASWDNTVRLWTLEGEPIRTLSGHQGWVYGVSFSHDGTEILTASYDNTAKLWTKDGHLITTLRGHEDGVVAAHFSADDNLIATASHDGTVKLWRRQGTLITTLRGHADRVSDVSFSRDGHLLATASEDKTVLIWKMDIQGGLDKLLKQGCSWTQHYLKYQASRSDLANLPENDTQPKVDSLDDLRSYCQSVEFTPARPEVTP